MASLSRGFVVVGLWFASAVLIGCGNDDASPEPVTDTGAAVDSNVPDVRTDAPVDSVADSVADSGDSATDTGVEDTLVVDYCTTTSVGKPCGESQPCVGGYICYGVPGSTGFCAPPTPQCGGFVMAMCPSGTNCLRPKGSSLGFCATTLEEPCVCRPDSGVDGC